MSLIDTGPGGLRPIDGVARVARRTGPGAESKTAAPAAARGAGSITLDAGQPPIDAERVAMLRKAIEEGRYPVIPMRVADAIVAAGLLLRSGK